MALGVRTQHAVSLRGGSPRNHNENSMTKKTAKDLYWGAILIVVGGFLLARNLGYIDFHFSLRVYWPVILILIGLSILINSWMHKQG